MLLLLIVADADDKTFENQEPMESAEEDDSPYSQTCRRRDPVYLASMAAHALPTSQVCNFFFYFLCHGYLSKEDFLQKIKHTNMAADAPF